MPDEPVTTAAAVQPQPVGDQHWAADFARLWNPPQPRVVVRADLLPALSVLSVVAVLGVPLGWLWSRLAPPQLTRTYDGGQLAALPLESYHRFDDLAVFVLLGMGFGLLTGFVVWRLRRRRGPVFLVAAVLGSVAAAWLGMRMGVSFAGSHYPTDATAKVGSVFQQAPVLESAWVLIAQPMATALAYGTGVAWCGMDDLGRRR